MESITCLNCGTILPTSASFCRHCGVRQPGRSRPLPAPPVSASPTPVTPPDPQTLRQLGVSAPASAYQAIRPKQGLGVLITIWLMVIVVGTIWLGIQNYSVYQQVLDYNSRFPDSPYRPSSLPPLIPTWPFFVLWALYAVHILGAIVLLFRKKWGFYLIVCTFIANLFVLLISRVPGTASSALERAVPQFLWLAIFYGLLKWKGRWDLLE